MKKDSGEPEDREEFGPLMSRLYSLMASKARDHKKIYRKITEDIVEISPENILEIGSGPGIVAAMIAENLPQTRIVCIDPSPSMVRIASRRFKKMGIEGRVSCSIGSSGNTSVEGKFDLIFTSISFHHWKDPEKDLRNIIEKHLGNGSLIIYENLVGTGEKKTAHNHGITKDYADGLEMPGVTRGVHTYGDLIIVRFSRIAGNEVA